MARHEDEIEVATDRFSRLGYTAIASLQRIEGGHAEPLTLCAGGAAPRHRRHEQGQIPTQSFAQEAVARLTPAVRSAALTPYIHSR